MVVKLKPNSYKQCWAVCALGLPVVLAVIVMAGCAGNGAKSMVAGSGGGGLKASSASISLENEGSVQLRIGDDPAAPEGQIVTLRLDITSMRAWNSTSSDAIDFLVDPISVELTHSSTVTVPIAQSGANPNTTYDRLDIVYAGVGIAYVDYPSGTLYNQELGALPSQTVDLSSSPITLGSDPVIVDVNVNVPSMIVLPPVGNWSPRGPRSMTARPMATGATLGGNPLVTASQSGTQSQSGQIQYLNGSVTKVVGNALTIKPTGNSSFTFQTSSSTDFEDATLGTALNAIVEVNGSTQADGSLFADEVELVDIANGTEMLGMVSSVAPDVQLSLGGAGWDWLWHEYCAGGQDGQQPDGSGQLYCEHGQNRYDGRDRRFRWGAHLSRPAGGA